MRISLDELLIFKFITMKRIILSLFLCTALIGCSNNDNDSDFSKESSNGQILGSGESAGEMHNDLLALFEQAEMEGRLTVDQNNRELSEEMIVVIDDYFTDKGFGSDVFSEMLAAIPDLNSNLNLAFEAGQDAEKLRDLLDQNLDKNTPVDVKSYGALIFEAIVEYENTSMLLEELEAISNIIIADDNLNSFYKEHLLNAISVAVYSNNYWYLEDITNNNGYTTFGWRDNLVHIVGSDTAGALLMLQSGAVAVGATIGGGWGGLAVLVGGAAASSYLASR